MNTTIAARIRNLVELDKLAPYVGIPAEELEVYKKLKDRNGQILYRLDNKKAQGYPIGISSQADIDWLFSFIPKSLLEEHKFNQRLKNIIAFGMFARIIGFLPEDLLFFRATVFEEFSHQLFEGKHWSVTKWPA
ncbi:MAG: hypothetical protein UV40_C0016G0013 [Parcubacteria group bacterium GW2011_GWA1_42_7]|nr:MAG: hypothetical protein UV34_C0001G0032 [Parcubacteria group bacterium GW2011_GWB1_42_6]KKS69721.1 MAG: hypothetical protein UV40_C0016G0013 [Parcubacteria group bacterium GW2011_GWA1_42_7]KKS92316.1 MAG: hypothetical protein UV67_C0006G0032 [Parcubacteria group bacterium GW2011_GWC1_43_12]